MGIGIFVMARPQARLMALALAGALAGALVSLVFSSMLPSTIEVVHYVNGVLRPTSTMQAPTEQGIAISSSDTVTPVGETASEDTQEVAPVDFAVAGVVAGAPGATSSQELPPSNFDVSGANAGLPATTSLQTLAPASFTVAAAGPNDPDAVASSALEPTTRNNVDPIAETEPVPYVNGVLRPTTTDAPSTSTTPKATLTPTAMPGPTDTPTVTPTPTPTPGPTDTLTVTPTPTPTKQPPPGDTDGDGCTDAQENGPDETLGGRRDYRNFWDFFDPDRDRSVGFQDFLAVIRHFGTVGDPATLEPDGPEPPAGVYWASADRGGQAPGGDPWDELPANGSITFDDFLSLLRQVGHTCA